jgi:hypothetical protein
VPKKAIQGTPWYQLLSNPLYEDGFNYIGAFIAEREKLIEDGYTDESYTKETAATANQKHTNYPMLKPEDETKEGDMTERCKRQRWEQSDMVMILMNLAYIPDEVAKKINFKPGW